MLAESDPAAHIDAPGPSSRPRAATDGALVIADQLSAALRVALGALDLPEPERGIEVTLAKSREHGDWQTNVALVLAKRVGEKPRELAERIAARLTIVPAPHVERVEVAGPGFLNFFLAPSWLHEVLRDVVAAGDAYGRGHLYDGLHVNLEFVSANPTGPLHAGGGR